MTHYHIQEPVQLLNYCGDFRSFGDVLDFVALGLGRVALLQSLAGLRSWEPNLAEERRRRRGVVATASPKDAISSSIATTPSCASRMAPTRSCAEGLESVDVQPQPGTTSYNLAAARSG